MTSLVLTVYSKELQRLETVDSYVSEQMLYSHLLRSIPILMLKGDATNMYKTQCMMRGLTLNLIEVEPGEHAKLFRTTHILHSSDVYPDFNCDNEVWLCSPTG